MDKNETTTGGITYSEPTSSEPKQKVSYQQALSQLEKQHRLGKLQCEMAEFRAREVQANMFYLDLLRKANSQEQPQPKMEVKAAETATGEDITKPEKEEVENG